MIQGWAEKTHVISAQPSQAERWELAATGPASKAGPASKQQALNPKVSSLGAGDGIRRIDVLRYTAGS